MLSRIRAFFARYFSQVVQFWELSPWDCVLGILIATLPFIDTLNGPLLQYELPSFGQIYKQLLEFALLGRLLYLSPLLGFLSISYGLPFILSALYAAIIDGEAQFLSKDIASAFKQILFTICLGYFLALRQKWGNHWLYWCFKNSLFLGFGVVTFNLVLGSVGIGFPQYTIWVGSKLTHIGTRGFMYDGNTLAAYLFFFALGCSWFIWEKWRKWFIPFLILVQFLALAKATKVGLLSAMACGIGIPIFYEKWRIFKNRYFVGAIGGSLLLLLLSGPVLWSSFAESPTGQRLVSMYQNVNLLTFILSDRNVFLEASLNEFANNYSLGEIVLGRGYKAALSSGFENDKTIELDFFDILMQNGMLGVFFSYGLWCILLLICLLRSFQAKQYPLAHLALLLGGVSFILSFLSGHIVGSGLLGPFNALFFTLAWIEHEVKV